MDKSKNIIENESGATSVLVILMMVVLVAFGSFAITTAYSNIKLSKTATEWSKMYYDLDNKGQLFLAEVDKRLYMAEATALDYMLNKEYEDFSHKDISLELQTAIRANMDENSNKEIALYDTINSVYYFYADKYLNEMKEVYPDSIVSVLTNELEISAIITDITFVSTKNPFCNLKISIGIDQLDYSLTMENGEISYIRPIKNRYDIIAWIENQVLPDIDNEKEVWDGTIG